MNNEPVAWMDKRTNKCVVFINTPPSDDWIPLYTHPAKTLTDEENVILEEQRIDKIKRDAFIAGMRQQTKRIEELEKEAEECWCGGHSYEYLRAKNRLPKAKTLTDEEIKEAKREALKEYYSVLSYQDEFELSWIDELFARAILKKASEK